MKDILDYPYRKNNITDPLISGATKTAILMAITAKGKTIIRHPYMKMDVIDLLEYIKQTGVTVEYDKDKIIIIEKTTLIIAISRFHLI